MTLDFKLIINQQLSSCYHICEKEERIQKIGMGTCKDLSTSFLITNLKLAFVLMKLGINAMIDLIYLGRMWG